jgi:hypothetical protein
VNRLAPLYQTGRTYTVLLEQFVNEARNQKKARDGDELLEG